MIQYVGRVSFAKNPDVASFNYPGTMIDIGMGIGVVLMCILNVGKEADYEMKQLEESEDN